MRTQDEKPYTTFSGYLKEKFGCRVYKVTIDAGLTCPNRDGALGRGGCIYCNNAGFSPGVRNAASQGESTRREEKARDERGETGDNSLWVPPRHVLPVSEQLEKGMSIMSARYKAEKFIAYFQAYTNTYAPAAYLERIFDEALAPEDVVGLAVGTRPDCIDEENTALLGRFAAAAEVWLELGLQSVHDNTLAAIGRGHDFASFQAAVARARKYPELKVCAHVILGLPGETREMMLESADVISDMGIEGVKVHMLHVLPDTRLERMYRSGEVELFRPEEYAGVAADYLERLSPEVIVQRLTGDAPRGLLVAPGWAADKRKTIEAIESELRRRGSVQGAGRKRLS